MDRRPSSWRKPFVVDVAIAAGVAVALLLLVGIATEEGASPPDLFAYLLAVLVGAALLWRRRFPAGVAVGSLLLVYGYHALDYPAVGTLPLAIALLSASYHSATAVASSVAVLAVVGTMAWFLIGEARPLAESLNFVVREAGVMAAVILTGSVMRSRRLLAEESQERLRLVRADQEAQAARRMVEDRMAIAREIHDVVAHTVALIGVQARVAAEALHDAPEEAERALGIISDSTRDATSELQATVGVLRGGHPSFSPAPGLDQLRALVESVSAGDLSVELAVSGERRKLPDLVELVAYRVIQEALTNTVKHARATRARVEVRITPTELEVVVTDDGIGGENVTGHGIAGMRERVDAVGGKLSVVSTEAGGFRVVARLPTGERA